MRHHHGSFADPAAHAKAWVRPAFTSGHLTDAEIKEARQGPEAVARLAARLRAEGRV